MAQAKLEKIEDGRYRLLGDVNLYNASQLASANTFSAGKRVTIDLGGLGKTDSGALALLVNWQRQALRHEGEIEYSNMPERLISLMHLYDLESVLKIK